MLNSNQWRVFSQNDSDHHAYAVASSFFIGGKPSYVTNLPLRFPQFPKAPIAAHIKRFIRNSRRALDHLTKIYRVYHFAFLLAQLDDLEQAFLTEGVEVGVISHRRASNGALEAHTPDASARFEVATGKHVGIRDDENLGFLD
jgi:hypothetical protein